MNFIYFSNFWNVCVCSKVSSRGTESGSNIAAARLYGPYSCMWHSIGGIHGAYI